MIDYYCKVYMKATAGSDEVFDVIRQSVSGQVQGRTIESEYLQIDLFTNKHRRADAPKDQFLDWPYYLEIDPVSEATPFGQHVDALADLIHGLEKKGWRCAAACDFEDELAVAVKSKS